MEEGGGHSRASRDAQPPDPCRCDGEDFAHLGPRPGKGGKSWVIYSLAVGVTLLQTFSDSWEDNSPELGPLWGGGARPPRSPSVSLCKALSSSPRSPLLPVDRQAGGSLHQRRGSAEVCFSESCSAPGVRGTLCLMEGARVSEGHHAEVITPPKPPPSASKGTRCSEPSQGDPDSSPPRKLLRVFLLRNEKGDLTDMLGLCSGIRSRSPRCSVFTGSVMWTERPRRTDRQTDRCQAASRGSGVYSGAQHRGGGTRGASPRQ